MVTSSRWRGAGALKSALLIDPAHILKKIKEGIKGIAKLLKTLHAPKKGTNDSVNKQSRWWLPVRAITPSNPRHAPDRLLKASILMLDSSMALTLTGTCLSLEEGKAAWGNLQFKLISLLSQHIADTWLQRITDWNITFRAIGTKIVNTMRCILQIVRRKKSAISFLNHFELQWNLTNISELLERTLYQCI